VRIVMNGFPNAPRAPLAVLRFLSSDSVLALAIARSWALTACGTHSADASSLPTACSARLVE
jgi:hypothetical protein